MLMIYVYLNNKRITTPYKSLNKFSNLLGIFVEILFKIFPSYKFQSYIIL